MLLALKSRKMKKKKHRAAREAYGEVKARFNVSLTPSVIKFLDERAESLELSRSELMERIFRAIMSGDTQDFLSEIATLDRKQQN